VNPRRLYRSRDRQLAGVAGGMAEYLDIDPTVVRILWIIVGIASGGLALLAYIVLALVVPAAPYAAAPYAAAPYAAAPGTWAPAQGAAPAAAGWTAPPAPAWGPGYATAAPAQAAPRSGVDRGIGVAAIVGVVLIVFGAIALADAALPGWIAGAIMGPAVILALGAALLVSSVRRRADEAPVAAPADPVATPVAPEPVATTWEVTDTQSVDPGAFGATTAAAATDAEDRGGQPA
jgi:phage shock protein C